MCRNKVKRIVGNSLQFSHKALVSAIIGGKMQALFVHGMGRSPLSGWPVLLRLRKAGVSVTTFGYFVSTEDFDSITRRLAERVGQIAAQGEYVVIGHSLGGVLLRAAISALGEDVPRPCRAFLLGSPVCASRLAVALSRNPVFRLLTKDCGQLVGSEPRMSTVAPMQAETTAVVGTRGFAFTRGWFGSEKNDGVVSASEVLAKWQHEQVEVNEVHSVLPASSRVAEIILCRIEPAKGLGRQA
jgi:pimeloyl-ACP methyl ester carboxylesterase